MAKKKNPFEKLDPQFKAALDGATTDQLKAKLSEISKNEEKNLSDKKADQDLNTKKAAVAVASEGYKEVSKRHKLEVKYVIQQLADKGDEVAMAIVQNLLTAEAMKGV